jgi:hypothetical protein
MKLIPLLLSFFLISGCSGGDAAKQENPVRVQNLSMSSWYNLMPGGPSSFHITGDVLLLNVSENPVKEVRLQRLTVMKGEEIMYETVPDFSPSAGDETYTLEPGKEKNFLFNSRQQLKTRPGNQDDQIYKVLLQFSADELEFTYIADSLTIEKVY